MDDQKLRAELESLAGRATEMHESAVAVGPVTHFEGLQMATATVRGVLLAVQKIGLLFDPPLEVVSEGPRYVVREKKRNDAAAFYTAAKGE